LENFLQHLDQHFLVNFLRYINWWGFQY
jgi:hypothetical protein